VRAVQVLLFDWDFSSAPDAGEEGYTFSRFADELVALMDEMKLSGAVYVGHSMAGMVLHCVRQAPRPLRASRPRRRIPEVTILFP